MRSFDEYIQRLPILSTHEHHVRMPLHEKVSLDYLFAHSYVNWCGVRLTCRADRQRFLDLMGGNSYFIWYERALNRLFRFGGELTLRNWDRVSDAVREAFRDPRFHDRLFKSRCLYQRAILDAYWNPGADNGRPDLYAPAFRINSFLYGYHPDTHDHNGHNAQKLYGRCDNFDDYLLLIERTIRSMKRRGCVCLKSALAYDRSLDFKPQRKRDAARVFGKPPSRVTPDAFKCFGDFIFDAVCAIAARHELPIQNHTGLGKLEGSNPLNLIPMIERHPGTTFVLFHGGYPWIEETAALLHNYANVVADICWLPAIGTTAAERALHSLIETGRDTSRITWGGDSWLATESYAHSLGIRYVVSKVLREKMNQGYLSEHRAKRLAERILNINARELYRLP